MCDQVVAIGAVVFALWSSDLGAQKLDNPSADDAALRDMAAKSQRFVEDFWPAKGIAIEGIALIRSGPVENRTVTRLKQVVKKSGSFTLCSSESSSHGRELLSNFCYGLNRDYCFELKKSRDGNNWLISRVVAVTPDFDDTKQGFELPLSFREVANHISAAPVALVLADQSEIGPWWNILSTPGFVIKSVTSVGSPGQTIRLEFSYEKEVAGKNVSIAGTVDFDPNMYGLPIASHQVANFASGSVMVDQSMRVAKTGDNQLEVVQRTRTCRGADAANSYEQDWEAKVTFGELPDRDFTLSAYGFSEPFAEEAPKKLTTHYWLLMVGSLLMVGFVILLIRSWWSGRAATPTRPSSLSQP